MPKAPEPLPITEIETEPAPVPAEAAEDINVPECMINAESLLEKLQGQRVMSGFEAYLKEALIAVKSVKGVPKQNYKSVRQLEAITELTHQVLNITEQSTAAI